MSADDSAVLNCWSWLYTIGAWVVVVGVVLEGAEIYARRSAKRKLRKFIGPLQQPLAEPQTPHWAHAVGDIGFLFLVIGLVIEQVSHQRMEDITGREGNRLTAKLDSTTRQAAKANVLASSNEFAAKQLETQLTETKTQLAKAETRLIELRNESLPMDIGEEYSFAETLKSLPGIQVKLRTALDAKAQRTAESLSATFIMAGWPIIDRRIIPDIGEEGIVVGHNADGASVKAAHLLLKQLTDRNVPAKMIERDRVRGVATNAIIVAVMQRPSQLKADLMLVRAKRKILDNESGEAVSTMMALGSKQFVVNSKELADAQAEYNGLVLRFEKIRSEESELRAQENKLWKELETKQFGTNAMRPGIHMYNSSFSGPTAIQTGTNMPVFMHGTRFSPPPLE